MPFPFSLFDLQGTTPQDLSNTCPRPPRIGAKGLKLSKSKTVQQGQSNYTVNLYKNQSTFIQKPFKEDSRKNQDSINPFNKVNGFKKNSKQF